MFKFEIQETLSRIVEVEAETEEEALYKLRAAYRDGDIVLDAEDFFGCNISPWYYD